MSQVEVQITLSPDELEKAYMGVDSVYAVSVDGRSIRFPVKILWPFITRDGIHGRFLIEFTQDHKFEKILRIA